MKFRDLGVAHAQRGGRRHQPGAQILVDRLVDQDALHADAALPGLIEGAEHDSAGGIGEVGVAVDDHGGVAAELEHHLLAAGLCLERPTDRGDP